MRLGTGFILSASDFSLKQPMADDSHAGIETTFLQESLHPDQ